MIMAYKKGKMPKGMMKKMGKKKKKC